VVSSADFARDGWIVARGVIAAEELEGLQTIFTALIPESPYYPRGPDGVLREITGAAPSYEPLARVARDPRFGALVARALGAKRVQLLQDSLLYKPAHDGGPVEWHQDHTYVGFLTPPRVVSLRIALLPETESSGCMRAVTGSHEWGPVGSVRALTETSVDSLLPSLSDEQRAAIADARLLVLEPGDVSIHHCLTVHGSGQNRSAQSRRTIILRMFDADCRLDATRLPPGAEVHFPCDGDGRLSSTAFPIVYNEL
jgi:phytanoyl-CoA hydroxylase